MKEMFEVQIVEMVISILSTIITAVILPLVAKLIMSKLNNDRLKGIVEDVSNTISRAVDFMEVRMTNQLKEDGCWNAETQKQVLNAAIDMAIKELSDSTIKNLKLSETELREYIEGEIEKYILNKKEAKALSENNTICLTGK